MKAFSGKSKCLLAVGLAAMLCDSAWGYRSGPPSGVNGGMAAGGANCSACHMSSTGFGGSVQILGVPQWYQTNAIYDLTVRIQDDDQAGAGFQISAEDMDGNHVGTLIVTDEDNTQMNSILNEYLNHTGNGVNNSVTSWSGLGNAAEYNLRWQAPPNVVGPVTFWAAGNAINDNIVSSGDHVYLTNETAGIPVPAVSEWGMLVLALLVTTAATIIAVRRVRPVPARSRI